MCMNGGAFAVDAEMMQACERPVVEPEFFELAEKLDRSLRIGHLRTSPGTTHWSSWSMGLAALNPSYTTTDYDGFGVLASMSRATSAARSGDITSPDSPSHTTPPVAPA